MQCPVCRVPLTPLLISGNTVVDYCKNCRGIWFDSKELHEARREDQVLQALLKTTSARPAPLRCGRCTAPNPRSARSCAACAAELPLNCPACKQRLEEVAVGKLKADRCPGCRGVWLDGGELETLFQDFQRIRSSLKPDASRGSNYTAGEITMDALIWAPDLVFHAAYGAGHLVAAAPEAIAHAAASSPELAGAAIEGAAGLASGAAEAAASAGEGAADLLASFFELLAGILD